MLTYKQNIFDILVKYEDGDSAYTIKSESGMRVERDDNTTDICICKDTLSFDDIELNISTNNLHKLNHLISELYIEFDRSEIKLSSYLYLHNEKVFINNISDIRNYGFLKMIFEKNGYFIIEVMPISTTNFETLENEVHKIINQNITFLKFPVCNMIHKMYSDIPVVFSPHAAGYLIHEILGHTLEYDIYKYYSDKYKNLQFSHKLNVNDDPEKISKLIGMGMYDDMGIPISGISLVENGTISNVLSLNSADSTDGVAHGVGRRENYQYGVLPRARCTYAEPVDNIDKQGIIEKYKQCILVNKIHSGGMNPQNGDFELNGIGFMINNNEIRNLIGNLKISGNILKNFNTIEYMGNDLEFVCGYCFKLGQNVRVAAGSPTISMYDISIEGDFCG